MVLEDLSWLPAFALSAGTLVGGAIYARKKGLPDLVRQAEAEQAKLIDALEGQLVLANAELTKLRPQLEAADIRIRALEDEVDRLERRIVKLVIRTTALEGGARE
jgi:capsule polysaccharide export protein KpsE/RkpR